MTDREAMQMALEALLDAETNDDGEARWDLHTAAKAALEAALAQPWDTSDMAYRPNGLSVEQSPVAYFDSNVLQVPAIYRCSGGWVTEIYSTPRGNCTTPLYTAPPSKPWVSLTSEELASFVVEHAGFPTRQLAAIEAALRSKNT